MTQTLPPTTRIAEIAPHAARMEQPLVSFRQIHPAGRSPAPAPAFLFGPSTPDLARAIFGQIDTPEIGVFAIADAAVAPTGIALRAGTAFCGAALNLPRDHVATITRRLDESPLPVRHVPGPLVPLFGPAEESVTQLYIDYLPRLWLLDRAGYTLADLRILVPASLPQVAEDLLAHLGIPSERLIRYAHWQEVIHTDVLLLPTVLRLHERLSPRFAEAARFWISRIQPPPAVSPHRRLYIAVPGQPANAHLTETVAAAQGYEIIHPHTLSLPARASLFSQATHIVGPAVPALLDSVFSPPSTRICALRDTARDPGFLQMGLGHTTGYVFTPSADTPVDEADYRRALEVMGL